MPKATLYLTWVLSLFCIGAVLDASAQVDTADDPRLQAKGLTYTLDISGADDTIRDLFNRVSILTREKNRPPRSYGALRARLDEDLKSFSKVLRSQGYYDARINHQLDSSSLPVAIRITVFPGPRYRISETELRFLGEAPDEETVDTLLAALNQSEGKALIAADVLAQEQTLLQSLPQIGYPLARAAKRRVVLDHEKNTASITYRLHSGPKILFGNTIYSGAENVDRSYLERLRPWSDGALYDEKLVAEFRQTLIRSRLFGSVRIGFADDAASLQNSTDTQTPEMVVDLIASDQRTISLGAGYSSTKGFGTEASWEHRNIFGSQELLKVTARAAEIEQSLRVSFRKPHFLREDQAFNASLGAIREDTDAFDSLELTGGAGLERLIGRYWAIDAATEISYTDIREDNERRTFLIGALPVSANWDRRDDILNPTSGPHFRVTITPHLVEQAGFFSFTKSEVEASTYASFNQDKIILAARTAFGSIFGAENTRLPASRRFFAGGGGSVRGFGFQDVGPRDAENDPLGGRSLFEAAFEARIRIGKTFGLVPFIDAGEVTTEKTPRFNDIRWGAGLGFRYYTDFAPIRIDLATPINRRPGDNRIQFYISLGQSF